MDTARSKRRASRPSSRPGAQIAALKSAKRASRLCSASLRTTARPTAFSTSAWPGREGFVKQIAEIVQGGLSLPDRDYYIVDSRTLHEIRAQYVEHVTKMFTLAGDTPEQAAKEAAAVMEIETAMAKASTSRTDLRDPEKRYHIYTRGRLREADARTSTGTPTSRPSASATSTRSTWPRRTSSRR